MVELACNALDRIFRLLRRSLRLVALTCCLFASQAQAAYKLASGDVLNVAVFGVPELQIKAAIDVDGDISFPLIGKIKVSGFSVEQVRTRIAEMIVQNAQSNGQTSASALGEITPNEITVSIAEYRPVYVTGDVARSGSQPFRPGLTVRQAIALAGGVDTTRGSLARPTSDERTALIIDYARERSRVWRLEQECELLNQSNQAETNSAPASVKPGLAESLDVLLTKFPAARQVISQIVTAETEQLTLDEANWSKEFTYLKKSKEEIDAQRKLLLQQQSAQQTEAQETTHDSQQVQTLYNAHLATLDRMAGARRESASIGTGLLQIDSLIIQTQRELDDLDQRTRQFESDQRIAKVRELEEAKLALAKLTAKLHLLGDTFVEGQTDAQNANASAQQTTLAISITRDDGGTPTVISANEDSEVAPGDTVNINKGGLTD